MHLFIYSLFPLLITSVLFLGCSTTYPNKNPVGQKFPSVSGRALSNARWTIPEDMKGEPVVLLIGFKQDSQFDIDRWLIGLDQTETKVTIFEIPTIQGMVPRMFKESIDEGMRRGIPENIWKAVITVYRDGAKVQKFTGNENPNNARVMLLDRGSIIRYFHDRGFSVPALNRLRKALAEASRKEVE